MPQSTDLPVSEKLRKIANERERLLKIPLAEMANRAEVRDFYRDAWDRSKAHGYPFRYAPREFTLEDDLLKLLDAFTPVDCNDPYKLWSKPDLKTIRRVAFRRCAFKLAGAVNAKLSAAGEGWLWLHKDYVMPRIPLAIGVGYGVVLGSFERWLVPLGMHRWFAGVFSAAALLISLFLIYVNVREAIGPMPEACCRAMIVFTASLVWSAILLGMGHWLATLEPAGLGKLFDWGVAISLGSSSLLVAIVVQFFFTKSGSIADPL